MDADVTGSDDHLATVQVRAFRVTESCGEVPSAEFFPHGFQGRHGRKWAAEMGRLDMKNMWVLDKGMSEEYKQYNASCRHSRQALSRMQVVFEGPRLM